MTQRRMTVQFPQNLVLMHTETILLAALRPNSGPEPNKNVTKAADPADMYL